MEVVAVEWSLWLAPDVVDEMRLWRLTGALAHSCSVRRRVRSYFLAREL